MSYSRNQVSLGAILQQAGLVSAEQVNQALEQQKQINSNLTIGEILASQGRIDSKTVAFFAQSWSSLIKEKPKQPIGQYLKQAALLNDEQIQAILSEQRNSQRKFGEVAISKGWLKETTLNFFLEYLQGKLESAPYTNLEPSVTTAKTVSMTQKDFSRSSRELTNLSRDPDYSQKVHEGFLEIKRKLLRIEGQDAYSEKALQRVLFWTNGHSLLTRKIFTLISQNINPLFPQQEEEQIDYLIQTKIIDDWLNNELGSHFKAINNRLINNQQCLPDRLFQSYQRILTESVLINESREQQELLNSGLVVRQQNKLVVANPIYRSVFNLSWVVNALNSQAKSRDLKISPQANSLTSNISRSSTIAESKNSWLNFKNILLLLTLIGLLSIFLHNLIKRVKVRTAFQRGNELLKQKSYGEAVEEYNSLLNIDSNYFQAWTNRGYALAGLQQYEAMRESCSTATIIDPTAVYAWNCQGEALHNLQRDTEAIVAFDRAISLNQTDPIFLINKSESLGVLGEHQASIDSITQAIQVLEQIEAVQGAEDIKGVFAVALTFLGNSYRQEEKFTLAISSYEKANNYVPQYFPARVGKGITLNRAERDQEARSQFESMLKDQQLTKVQKAQTWFYLGKSLCKLAPNPKGIAAFDEAIKLNPDYETAKKAKQYCR